MALLLQRKLRRVASSLLGVQRAAVPTASGTDLDNAPVSFTAWSQGGSYSMIDVTKPGNVAGRAINASVGNVFIYDCEGTASVSTEHLGTSVGRQHVEQIAIVRSLNSLIKTTILSSPGALVAARCRCIVFSAIAWTRIIAMTDKAIRAQMVAKAGIAEGDGVDLVVICAPR
jgi:hypothetical protein